MFNAQAPLAQRLTMLRPLFLAFVVLLIPQQVLACTAFLLENPVERVFAKSYDWPNSRGHLLVNRVGVQKRALILPGQGTPAQWESLHASATFNQYGREFPNGGMNDAGLMVEILWLEVTQYAKVDEKPAINALQWVQFQLDSYATTAEVVKNAPNLRIAQMAGGKTHYMVCDKSGDCATIEYLRGKLVVITSEQLKAKALTNNTCQDSQQNLLKFQGFGGAASPQGDVSSLSRHARASALTKQVKVEIPMAQQAFADLENVRNPALTKWQIVYQPTAGKISWRTATEPAIKTLDMAKLTARCDKPTLGIDVDAPNAGDITTLLRPFALASNRALVEHSFALLHANLSSALVEGVATAPDKMPCAARPSGSDAAPISK